MSKHPFSVGLVAILTVLIASGSSITSAVAAWPNPDYGVLYCWPAVQWTTSGHEIVFTAGYDFGTGYTTDQLSWRATGASPSRGSGDVFETTYWVSSQQTRTVTVTDGYQTATCTVYIDPVSTPSPTPTSRLRMSPESPFVDSGERITFTAWGGDGSYDWNASGGSPSDGRGSSFSTRFTNTSSTTQYHRVEVTSDDRTIDTWVGVYPDDSDDTDDDLSCVAGESTVDSGESVTFRAYGDGTYFSWSAPKGDTERGWGRTFSTRFHNSSASSKRFTVEVSNRSETEQCTVTVRGTDTDSDDDSASATITHTVKNITRGDEGSSVTAREGDRIRFTIRITPRDEDLRNVRVSDELPWRLSYVSGSTVMGTEEYVDGITTGGISFGTLREDKTYVIRFDATVTGGSSGWVTNRAEVRSSSMSTQTRSTSLSLGGSTWTPSPTVAPIATSMTVNHVGRNVSRGQSKEYTTVRATGGETLDMILRVSNPTSGHLSNVRVTEYLPAGLTPIPGTTAVDGVVVSDGITSSGITIGSIAPYSTKVVKVSVRVDGSSVPANGQVTTSAQVRVSADGNATRSASMVIYLGTAPLRGGAGTVDTGPMDSTILAFMFAFLLTGAYAAYTRTDVFGRRLARAEVSGRAGAPLNFSR